MTRILFMVLVLLPVSIGAEMYECEGVWKNTPCDAQRLPAKKKDRTQSLKGKEVSASDILQEEDPGADTREDVEPEPTPDLREAKLKSFMVQSLPTMNRACGNFYTRGRIKKFESVCMRPDTTAIACEQDWSSLHAEMLGRATDQDCRNAVFNSTNQFATIK